jgi:hypothetical protein
MYEGAPAGKEAWVLIDGLFPLGRGPYSPVRILLSYLPLLSLGRACA